MITAILLLSFITIIIIIPILIITLKFIIIPKLKLTILKNKHQDKIEIIHRYGLGIIQQYKQGYEEQNDSMHFLRNMRPNLKAMIFNVGSQIGYSFLHPELIQQVLSKHHHSLNKLNMNPIISLLFQNSILLETGKQWQRQRSFLGKSFHFDEIKNYFKNVKNVTEDIFKNDNIFMDDSINDKQEIFIVKQCEKVTSEVVFEVFFGQTQCDMNGNKINQTSNQQQQKPIACELVDLIQDSYQLLQSNKFFFIKAQILKTNCFKILPQTEEQQILQRLNKLKSACNNIILKRKEELINNPTLYKYNFLDLYLKEIIINKNNDITFNEITDNFLALYFAGTDTTSNMTAVALYYLSLYPEIQKKARSEIFSITQKKINQSSSDSKQLYDSLTFDDLSSMNYINAVLKEALRIIPPAIGIFPREAIQDFQIDEFKIKKGDLVNTHFIYHQQNPDIFPNPHIFNPDRWIDNKTMPSSMNFTPFSQGGRNCIGQHLAMIEGKCMLAYILLNYMILPKSNEKIKLQMKIIYGITNDNIVYFQKLQNYNQSS